MRVMSAVVKKSLLCCLNKRGFTLELSNTLPRLEAVAAGPLALLSGLLPKGQTCVLGKFTRSQGMKCFLMACALDLMGGCSLSWFVQLVEDVDAAPAWTWSMDWPGWVVGFWLERTTWKERDDPSLWPFPGNLGRG